MAAGRHAAEFTITHEGYTAILGLARPELDVDSPTPDDTDSYRGVDSLNGNLSYIDEQ